MRPKEKEEYFNELKILIRTFENGGILHIIAAMSSQIPLYNWFEAPE